MTSSLRHLFPLALPFLALLIPSDGVTRPPEEPPAPVKFDLRKGDHISLLGNSLAERMQHDGWLETYLSSRFPGHDLVIRNLAFPADELTTRLRSAGFGSPDHWLKANKSDVVFAFFGYNESFGDKAGLDKFKTDLANFITSTLKQRYNGTSAPRLVLFSPIAHENLKDPNLPDGKENNRRIALYTSALAGVALKHRVAFVDLYHPTLGLYNKGKGPLTTNGVHLNLAGNEQVARIIDAALFAGPPAGKRDPASLARLRSAILDRNFYWFQRYRTTDGYSIYGGRADLRFVGGQTNRVVMQREMEVLDALTANRDRRVWALAQGKDISVDDSNLPPFIPVKTNKPGPLPGGKHRFLDGEEAIGKMKIANGLKVNLFASEKQFPDLVNPVQMSFDARGRLWVAVWPTYPHWKPREAMNDKILILEDTDGDGKADKCTVFAEGLHCPTGFEFWGKGLLVAQAPDVLYMEDSKGTGRADVRRRVVSGIDSADTHHTSNSFALDPGGAMYFQEGTFHHTQVESPWGPPVRCANAGVFRYEPRSQKFGVYVSYGFANPHGHAFDHWGRDIVIDGTGAVPYDAALFSGFLPFPLKHPGGVPTVYRQRTRPCPGIEFLSSRHFPDTWQGNLLVPNVIGFQGILRYQIRDDGASFQGTEQEPLLSSTDPNFRPSDLKVGPDGAIYFIDWHNPIIGHMQHNLRDPSRDREHGRVYRVTYPSRPLLRQPKIAGEPVAKLLELLKEPEDRVRQRARIELAGRPTKSVIDATRKWAGALDKTNADFDHRLLEALWLHQSHNVVDGELLERVLKAKEPKARAAATRIISYWHDRLPNSLDLLRKMAADGHPRVRLEAVRAASFFTQAEAVEVPLVAKEKSSDPYLDYVYRETMRALQPHVQKALADGRRIDFKTPAGARYFLRSVRTEDLLAMKRSPGVYRELLFRPGVQEKFRREALGGLAKAEKKGELDVLLGTIRANDEQEASQDESVAIDLARLLTARPVAQLKEARVDLQNLATKARQPVTRQLGLVALIAADGRIDPAWKLATQSTRNLQDIVQALPWVADSDARAQLYPRVAGLLKELPGGLGGKAGKTVAGRYVRIELPGKQRTLTLAEVEVFSAGVNIARRGKATQSSTAHGGVASRAIDGDKSGSYGDGGQTHTREGTVNPWWQVDLGTDLPIDSIAVYNRTDGNLGSRLNKFTLKILDGDRQVVFEKKGNPAPPVKAEFAVSSGAPLRIIRRATMLAMAGVRGKEAETVKALAPLVGEDADRESAIRALQRIPARWWPADSARPVVDRLLAHVRRVPVKERTAPAVVDALQLADGLAGLLPPAEARKVRRELGELGVRVLRLGTVVEQMLYDRERLVVQAGKPFEVIFENTDTMPHNFVILQPGALEEIGDLAEKTATDPKAAARQYVPASPKVLLGSRLLQPREQQRLSFTAPAKAGVYPYVCTYPGHWRRMHGALYVVADLEEYQANPTAYLAKRPLKIADPLLALNRPRTEWKLAELAPAAKSLHGRNHRTGKQMFQVATCVGCHKLQGVGQEFAPDLTKLDPKWTPVDVLEHILEPSKKIDDKYRNWQIELKSGKNLTGMIVEETPTVVRLIENPLASVKPLEIKKASIAVRTPSPTSPMPKGLLDKLTREEVLDLLAYVVAGGQPGHRAFQEGHAHGH